MLGRIKARWRRWLTSAAIERQVEEELRFHCEMLTHEYQEGGLSEEAARDAAGRRFGDVERIQAQCVEISRRNRPAVKLLKLFLLMSFMTGVWLRLRGVDLNFLHLGNLLMAIGVLGQLLLRLRGLTATGSLAVKRSPPLSLLGRGESLSIEAYDEHGRTPVERLVADKAYRDS